MPPFHQFAAAVLIIVPALAARGQSVTLEPAKDNSIQEDAPPGGTFSSSGAGSFLFAGNNAGGSTRRALIQFDLDSAIPANASVTSVSLRMRMSMSNAGVESIALHRALKDWGEADSDSGDARPGMGAPAQPGDATWEHTFFDDQFWDQDGGDFAILPSAASNVAGVGIYTWVGEGLIADVEAWLGEPDSNFGWFIIGDESASVTAKRFDSRDNDVAANRPMLTIEFDLPVVLGDMDGNGTLDAFDVDDFELALADPQGYDLAHPGLDRVALGDFDLSGALDAFDVGGFEVALASGGASVPEPTSAALLALGLALAAIRGNWPRHCA